MKTTMGAGIALAVGALGGVWIGSRSVKNYDWRTEWTIPAPISVVYEAMTSRDAVREWWPDMELVEDVGDDDLHVGSTVSFRVHQAPAVARLAPPLRINCLYTDVEPESRLRETVEGDLSGVLETLFHEQEDGTRITFSWYVRVTNPALNLLGYVADRMYRHSHDHVMKSGERGLSEYCLRRT
ncbi:MAG: SRPBCC domain-containing protein [Rubrobacteraceae bacterium]|nr:SRPBCC domain-containing protein [Rubrobacteraceae bacterium]